MTAIDRLPAHHDASVTVYPGDASREGGLLRRLRFALLLFGVPPPDCKRNRITRRTPNWPTLASAPDVCAHRRTRT